MVKFYQYFFMSFMMSVAMIAYACFTREQFYPIILLLVTSKVSFVIGANMVLATFILSAKIGIRIFFKELRDAEVEVIRERVMYSVSETLLALTIFRNELSPTIFLFFGMLVFCKIFHMISRSRLDYLEQVARVTLYQHSTLLLAIVSMLLCSVVVSYCCVVYSINEGKTVIILFAFEFGVLVLTSISNFVRYVINVLDGYFENGLQYKGLYFMVLDLICDGLRFCTYVGFFCIVFVYYGLPIHIIRDVYMAFMSFFMRLTSFVRYMKLTRNLDARLEDASAEDLAAHEEGGCLICREDMASGKKLACGHVFHLNCLRTWLQHQQTCPLCRANIEISSTDGPGGGERQRREQRALAAAVAAAERVGAQAVQGQEQGGNQGLLHGDGDLVQQVNNRLAAAADGARRQQPAEEMRRQEQLRVQHQQPQQHLMPAEEVERGAPRGGSVPSSVLPQQVTTAKASTAIASRGLLPTPASSSAPDSSSLSAASSPRSIHHGAGAGAKVTSIFGVSPSHEGRVPGFFVSKHVLSVHQRPLAEAPVVRSLPAGLIVFVKARLNQWANISGGWVVGEHLRPYIDTTEHSNLPADTGGARSDASLQRGSTPVFSSLSFSSTPRASSGPDRVTRILRMRQDMTRLQRTLEEVQAAMGGLSRDLLDTLQDEVELQVTAASPRGAASGTAASAPVTIPASVLITATPSRGGDHTESAAKSPHCMVKATEPVQQNLFAPPMKQASDSLDMTIPSSQHREAATTTVNEEKSVGQMSSGSAFNIPVAVRSASTPTRLPGSKLSSPFGHLLRQGAAPSSSALSPVTSSGLGSPVSRDTNTTSAEKASPSSSSCDGVPCLVKATSTPIPASNMSASTPNSSPGAAAGRNKSAPNDLRELRAKYYRTPASPAKDCANVDEARASGEGDH